MSEPAPAPAGRSAEPALARVRTVAHLLDESTRIPGTSRRIGLGSIVGGSVPLVGTVFDAVWTADARNARLVADHLEGPSAPTARGPRGE